jgi:hypothetical protein
MLMCNVYIYSYYYVHINAVFAIFFSFIQYYNMVILIYTVLCGKKLLGKIFSFSQTLLTMVQKLISLSKVYKRGNWGSVVSIVTILQPG